MMTRKHRRADLQERLRWSEVGCIVLHMTNATASLQDSVAHMRDVAANDLVNAAQRVELKKVIAELKDTELGAEFVPGSFKLSDDGLSFTAQVAAGFGYGFMNFRRGERVTFNANGEILY